jgi:hypothetical protein
MPSFMSLVRLVGGHGSWIAGRSPHPEPTIIREKTNESKGLLQTLAIVQAFEQTGFFAVKRQFRGLKPPEADSSARAANGSTARTDRTFPTPAGMLSLADDDRQLRCPRC